jgi:hypothetical protein
LAFKGKEKAAWQRAYMMRKRAEAREAREAAREQGEDDAKIEGKDGQTYHSYPGPMPGHGFRRIRR